MCNISGYKIIQLNLTLNISSGWKNALFFIYKIDFPIKNRRFAIKSKVIYEI